MCIYIYIYPSIVCLSIHPYIQIVSICLSIRSSVSIASIHPSIHPSILFQQIISGQSWLGNNPKLQRNQQSSQSNTTQAVVQGLLLNFKELQDANALCKSFDFDQLRWPHQSHDSELLGDLSVFFFLVHLGFLCALWWVDKCVHVFEGLREIQF